MYNPATRDAHLIYTNLIISPVLQLSQRTVRVVPEVTGQDCLVEDGAGRAQEGGPVEDRTGVRDRREAIEKDRAEVRDGKYAPQEDRTEARNGKEAMDEDRTVVRDKKDVMEQNSAEVIYWKGALLENKSEVRYGNAALLGGQNIGLRQEGGRGGG